MTAVFAKVNDVWTFQGFMSAYGDAMEAAETILKENGPGSAIILEMDDTDLHYVSEYEAP